MLAGKQKFFIVILKLSCFLISTQLQAQFAPGPDSPQTTAVFRSDSRVSFWADSAIISRSWQNIADTSLGKTTIGIAEDVLGKSNARFVSLGDGGEAILSFPYPIYNEDGFDFAVFENGFAQNGSPENFYFLELARVQVSQNGVDFIEFEAVCNVDSSTQVGPFSSTDCTLLNNLAGKYPLHYGTPFDIEELGLDSIISIKIIDVIGSTNNLYANFDRQGNIINDPYPTPFASCGFDLNAIAALNQKNGINDTILNIQGLANNLEVFFYPSLLSGNEIIYFNTENNQNKELSIFNELGQMIYHTQFKNKLNLGLENLSSGIYYFHIRDKKSVFSSKFIVK